MGERHGVEVGVTEEVAAVHVRATESFGDDVDLRGAAVPAEFGQVITAQDVEDFNEDDTAGTRRRRSEHLVAVVVTDERRAFPCTRTRQDRRR